MSRPVRLAGSCAVAAALMIAGGLFWRSSRTVREPLPLSYRIEHGALGDDGTIRVSGSNRGDLRFSDGTDISLEASARAQLAAVDADGARIALLDGEIVVKVVHRPTSRWRFDTGPFSVLVEGTAFSLRWTAADERLRLRMYTGTVTVKGPLGADAISVRAGQVLTVRVPSQHISLEPATGAEESNPELGAPLARPEGEPPAPSRNVIAPAAPASSVSARHAPGDGGMSWRELIAAGRSADVVADALARGLGVTFSRARREDLAALADAARYSRHNDIARGALHALRDRFSGTERARDAAFFLGVLDEADNPGSTRSLDWYRRYRLEAPTGLYVSDALGREMQLTRRLQGERAARAAAREYLTRFPEGQLSPEAAEIVNR